MERIAVRIDWPNRHLELIDLPKRCPDCGGEDVTQTLSVASGSQTYECDGCGLQAPSARPFEEAERRTNPVHVGADYLPLSGYSIYSDDEG